MTPARVRAAAVLLVLTGLAATPSAGAQAVTASLSAQNGDVSGTIGTHTETGSGNDRHLKVNFSASEIDNGVATPLDISKTGATVTVQPANGQSSRKGADVSLTSTENQTPTVILALDVSGSMRTHHKFDDERQAALAFIGSLTGTPRIGIVTFGSPATVALQPTRDLQIVKKTITRLPEPTDASTGLYQAILVGAKLLSTKESKTGPQLLVMVTDGDDAPNHGRPTAKQRAESTADQAKARKAISAKTFYFRGVVIGDSRGDLQKVAQNGDVLTNTASVAQSLAHVYAVSKATLDKAVTLTVPLDPGMSGSVTLIVNARTGNRLVSARKQAFLSGDVTPTAPAKALPVATSSEGLMISTPVMLAALLAVFLAMTVMLTSATGAFGRAGKDAETPISRALSFYSVRAGRPERVVTAVQEPSGGLSGSKVVRTAIRAINRVARQRKLDRALDARLEGAGLPIRTAEWSLLHVGSGIAGGLLLLVASRGMVLGAILGLVLGLVAPWLFLALRKSRRETKFLAQLPDTLQLLAGSLAAGYSLPQAMDAVLREAQPPISVEFNRALVETRLGMPPEDSLDGIAARTDSRDFSWIVMAIRIQRDVGGNLAELLSTVAETLRERERLRRQVKALSAEGRLSGIILGSLPVVFALFLIFTKPEYIAPLFQTQLGWVMVVLGSVLLVAGSFWMAKVVAVEV